ncbi:MAG: TonB-dependent receptor [Bryobacteraceae bacterium]|nr:TonB-dependent receptor [Solibacteraceae bacterium]MCL4840622.1 TonB-dependent receptor [Bryobacteraceae bacterium]MCO5350576.1 TonB-dependent receptor [Bryobacteraceae bacterium]
MLHFVFAFVLTTLSCLAQAPPAEVKPESAAEPVYTAITVTATLGRAEAAAESAPVALIREEDELRERPLLTIGNALESAPGILVQQTSTSQVSPFLRGLTGYQVLNLIDGIRFNNSTFRSGPNQYLAFVEPGQARQVEAVLGPAGSLYGSDAMGGSIQVLTVDPRFATGATREWHGDLGLFAGSADRSGGLRGQISLGTARAAWLAGGTARRHNDLRPGGGFDSRHAFRRLFDLDPGLIRSLTGARLRDTAFSQTGAHTKLALRPSATQSFTAWYQFSEQTGTDGYKDLWGGLGRMQSKFEPQRVHFAYARYEKLDLGWLDRLAGTLSCNSMSDGTVRQGMRATDTVITDTSRVNTVGYTGQGAKQFARGLLLTFGADLYDERISAARLNNVAAARPLYPDGSRYTTTGLYAQGIQELFNNRLRALAGVRFTRIGFRTRDDARFGVPASQQSFHDVTMNGSLTFRLTRVFEVHALGGRGFRAPNLNDLGALGLNDLGYEIPASEAPGALLGNNAGESAVPTGKSVESLRAESLWNAELGVAARTRRVYARVHGFHADLIDPIVRRTLLFPLNGLPTSLAGLAVTPNQPAAAQQAQGVTTVATAFDPRGVKAFVNDGQSKYYGLESLLRFEPVRAWRFEGGYSFIAGRDLYPNRPMRRLPPQSGFASVRWLGHGRLPWLELRADAAGPQNRLSGGDRDDERIGAGRSLNDIAAFFNGSRVAPYLDDSGRFTPTGETLPQIQARVLPGVTVANQRIALYSSTAGWVSLSFRGGLPLTERLSLQFALDNLADRNFRVHGSGIDAPGFNAWAALRWQF